MELKRTVEYDVKYDASKRSTNVELQILVDAIKRELKNNPIITKTELSIKFNISERRINTAFKRICNGGYLLYHTTQLRREIATLYANGLSQQEIAKKLSMTDKTVRSYISSKLAKSKNIYKYKYKSTRWEQIKSFLDEGKTYAEIASIIGCTKQNIQRICSYNGYKRNKRRNE